MTSSKKYTFDFICICFGCVYFCWLSGYPILYSRSGTEFAKKTLGGTNPIVCVLMTSPCSLNHSTTFL